MGRSIDKVIAGLSRTRRRRIETKAMRLAKEMIEHGASPGYTPKTFSTASENPSKPRPVIPVARFKSGISS